MNDFNLLFKFGGFPEPCLRGEERFWRRWQRERLQRVIYDDIRDLENIKEISLLELLASELPNRVGAPLSVKNLKEVLQVAHETVDRWINIFEKMYYCFRIPPYGARKVRSVKKEQKLYLSEVLSFCGRHRGIFNGSKIPAGYGQEGSGFRCTERWKAFIRG